MKRQILFSCACLSLLLTQALAQNVKRPSISRTATRKVQRQPNQIEQIDQFIQSYAANHLFNGSILVAGKDGVIFKKGYGLANMEWGIPNSPDTKFRIGSVTKQLTAMLIMRLKQDGNINLEGKITDYLPWYRKDTGDRITIHQLLTHTSGIPNFTEDANAFADIDTHSYSFREIAAKYCSGDLEFEPGTKFKYDNSGYYLLGAIIEAVTQKPYAQVLKEKIFDVVGMHNTGIDNPSVILRNRAAGYSYDDSAGYRNIYYINPETTTYSAGAVYSTVEDLYLWEKALFAGKLLAKENQEIMFTPHLGRYAYGLYVNKFKPAGMAREVTVIGHNGGIPGFSASLIKYVEDNITIILLDNTTVYKRGNLENISLGIFQILNHDQPKKLKPAPGG